MEGSPPEPQAGAGASAQPSTTTKGTGPGGPWYPSRRLWFTWEVTRVRANHDAPGRRLARSRDRLGRAAPTPPLPKTGNEPKIDGVVVNYKGKMVDESGKSVSGIFPMTFSLYPSETSKKAAWAETKWVAVDRGAYTVRLGEEKKLPPSDKLSTMLIGVEIRGVGEVVREPFSSAPAAAQGGGTGPAKHQPSQRYADNAGYAVEADHAKNADRLQNLSVEDLLRKVMEAAGNAMSTGAGPAGPGGKATIGSRKRFGNRVGGTGGGEFEEMCPKGYMMTGLKGGAAAYVDAVQIVCSPLE